MDRGWLTKETVVQLKLYNDPIRMWKKSLHGKSVIFIFLFFYICVKNKSISMLVCFCYLNLQFRVKVTPVDVDFPCNNTVRDGGVDESWDVQDVRNAVKSWPLIEVAVRVFLCNLYSFANSKIRII